MNFIVQKVMQCNKGATSVLVIFMMLILVTLGAFAITAANANFKFSQRALDWNAMYYDLDAKGEEYLAAIDYCLAEAEAKTLDYFQNDLHSAHGVTVPANLKDQIIVSLQNDYINDAFVKLYMFYADIYLKEMAINDPVLNVYANETDSAVSSILLQMELKSDRPGAELSSLVVSLWVDPVEYQTLNGSLQRVNDNMRYIIEDWYERQEPIYGEQEETELWDGTL